MKISIVYSSRTGNTKMLAEAIYNKKSINNEIAYFGEPADEALDGDIIYLGFWTDKGTADNNTIELIRKIKNKRVFLFGTAGFGGSNEYFKTILHRVEQRFDISVDIIGDYMCQGRMPISVRERYVRLKDSNASIPNLDGMIENFDKALTHPNKHDIDALINLI